MILGAKSRKLTKIFMVVFLNLVAIAIPIIFYFVNLSTRPMLVKDIANLNNQCGSELTG